MDPFAFFIECLFPTRCVACQAAGEWWCARCRESVGYVRHNLCSHCASAVREHACPNVGTSPLDGLVAAGFYHARPLREVLQAFKYQGVTRVTPSIAKYFCAWKDARTEAWPWEEESSLSIQSLPAASNRVRERGFDQAELIAGLVQGEIAPWATRANLLQRKSAATAQASLAHGTMRDANVRGVFTVMDTGLVPPNILVIDDVVTTGSTMREAARVLRAAGAEKIYGVALAVGA